MKNLSKVSLIIGLMIPALTQAAEVKVAVAANFKKPLEEIAKAFQAETGNTLAISAGATGQLYTQIKNGAPFEVFISADSKTPKKLVDENVGIQGTSFTYAKGQLVLWSADEKKVDKQGAVLTKGDFTHIAIANPKTAPYGAAAVEVIDKLGLTKSLASKMVEGESIAQTKQFIDSGSAEIGFVALSQVYKDGKVTKGSAWMIPATYYKPILQDVVLLKNGEKDDAAKSLLKFLKGDKAKVIIKNFGYQI